MAHAEIRPCSADEIIEAAMKYKYNSFTRKQHESFLKDNLYLAFGAYKDGVLSGYVFSMKLMDRYTMDGYYSGRDILWAVKVGRLLCEKVFDVADEIWTSHKIIEKSVTATCMRIGFRYFGTVDDNIVMLFRRKNGN